MFPSFIIITILNLKRTEIFSNFAFAKNDEFEQKLVNYRFVVARN